MGGLGKEKTNGGPKGTPEEGNCVEKPVGRYSSGERSD